jgi:23S rRNA pseudouridine1911/1915/1917 synthase
MNRVMESQEPVVELEVPPGYAAGERLDQYLAERLAGMSRSKTQQAIKSGHVHVNDRVQTKVSTPVQPGDRITARLMRPAPIEARPEPIPLDVVYEDDALLVVNKPAGLVAHPAYGHRTGTLVNALLHHVGGGTLAFDDDEEDGEDDDVGLSTGTAAPSYEGDVTVRPGIVHRLDKDTSGLLIVAKHDASHRRLSDALRRREIRRAYFVAAWGHLVRDEVEIDAPIGRSPKQRQRMAVVPAGRPARTKLKRMERWRAADLLRAELDSGRTHQIRVHLAHIGRPVVGDRVYGAGAARGVSGPDRTWAASLERRVPRQFLHAAELAFRHPISGAPLTFKSPLPPDLDAVVRWARQTSVLG